MMSRDAETEARFHLQDGPGGGLYDQFLQSACCVPMLYVPYCTWKMSQEGKLVTGSLPVSDDTKTVLPIHGYESLGDGRSPSCSGETEVPSAIRDRLGNDSEAWAEQVARYLNEGLRDHLNIPGIHYTPFTFLILLVVLIVFMERHWSKRDGDSRTTEDRNHAFFQQIGILMGIGFFVLISMILLSVLDHLRNVDMERRCSDLSQRFKANRIAFGFAAFRTSGGSLLKPLKFLIVYHEADHLNGHTIVSNPAVLELDVLQRRYTAESMDNGREVRLQIEGAPPASPPSALVSAKDKDAASPSEKAHKKNRRVSFNPIIETSSDDLPDTLRITTSRL